MLSYDPYGPARMLLIKSSEKVTWWGPDGFARTGRKNHPALLDVSIVCVHLYLFVLQGFFIPFCNKNYMYGSYDKMLIDWVRLGRTGKYLALGHLYGPRCARSVRHDIEPNIFPSGPPTPSISTYDLYSTIMSVLHAVTPLISLICLCLWTWLQYITGRSETSVIKSFL